VILSNDIANKNSPVVIVAPISSAAQKKRYQINVTLPQGQPLPKESTVYCGQLRTVAKERLLRQRGSLTSRQMLLVGRAVAISVGLLKP
jgi:mRNA-degrading endonuclease toxin of MazEF toxin-antitoxin module